MDFIKNFQPTPMKLLKLAGILLAALVVLAVAAHMFAPRMPLSIMPSMPGSMAIYGNGNYDTDESYADYSSVSSGGSAGYDMAYSKEMEMGYNGTPGAGTVTLSARNVAPMPSSIAMPIAPMPPVAQTAPGADSEKFEVTEYSAQIETRKRQETCDAFTAIKAKDYVVFENSNAYDYGCSFTFKVEADHVEEILAWLKDLNPKYLNENTYTVKAQLDDFTSEEDILKKKLVEIDATLKSATTAYDEVTRLATQTRDAGSLASIIQSRIQIIQQLTQERIYINEQLDRLARSKADQLDHLDYTYFRVDVSENKFIDGTQLKDSWKQAMRDVVRVINEAIQGVTINLLALFFIVLQWALYALILLVIAKYAWQFAVRIWKS